MVRLYGILKCMNRLMVKLKAIKYKKEYFYYLSYYPSNLGH